MPDHRGVVDPFAALELDRQVVVEPFVETVGAEGKGADELVLVQRLLSVGNDAGFVEVDHGVDEHLGVNAQILLFLEGQRRRIRYVADPQLDGCSVVYKLGKVVADRIIGFIGLRSREGWHLLMMFHEVIDITHMDMRIAEGAR